MPELCIVLTVALLTQPATPPDSYITRVEAVVEACRSDIPAMEASANAAAERLVAGGKLWAAGQPAWVSELSGRAGGLMMLQNLGDKTPEKGDVVLFAQGDNVAVPGTLVESSAFLVVFGGEKPEQGIAWFPNHADAAGISPTLANVVPAWVFSAELIGALTRLGKMPVMFETIGLPGGYPRINTFRAKGIFWHETHDVPRIEPGVLSNRYADGVAAILRRIEQENRGVLDTAGAWAAEAKSSAHRVIMYSMGHFLPDEIGKSAIGADFESGVWNSGFTAIKPPDDTYASGDVVIHIGYQHPPYGLFERARPAGARVVYVDILRHRDYSQDPGVLWIDPMWPWSDACVQLEGYDIPILPPSGIVNSAIAWEIYRVARQKMAERR